MLDQISSIDKSDSALKKIKTIKAMTYCSLKRKEYWNSFIDKENKESL